MLWIKQEKTELEFFEVAIGTILVQNTNWVNVNKAIFNIISNISSFSELININEEMLIEWIRPAGFYHQKSKYLRNLSQFLIDINYQENNPNRNDLLKIKGIGNETADSLLNFCFQQPIPVIGTYTRRLFARYTGDASFLKIPSEKIQQFIINSFPKANAYQLGHFHALIVVHNQNICQKVKPKCSNCIFEDECWYGTQSDQSDKKKDLQALISPTRKSSKLK